MPRILPATVSGHGGYSPYCFYGHAPTLFDGGAMRIAEPAPLVGAAWDGHVDYLTETYPTWAFDQGSALQ